MNNKLIAYRKMLKINQAEMANVVNVSSTSYNRKEVGKIDFTQSEMINIVNFFKKYIPDLTMDDIFFDKELSKLLSCKLSGQATKQ